MRLISEVKNLEKSKGDLNLSDLSTRKNRIKSIIVTDDKALKEFRAKISKFAPRQSVPNKILNSQIRNIKLNLNKSTSSSKSKVLVIEVIVKIIKVRINLWIILVGVEKEK